jgi:hypothetical protein
VRLLWMLWNTVEKAEKPLPTLHMHRKSSAPLQLNAGSPPLNWIVARNSPCDLRNSLQRAALLRFHRSAESTVGAFAITQIVGKSGEKTCVFDTFIR